MAEVIDQRARDDAKDAKHKAETNEQLFNAHMSQCALNHEEDKKHFDKLETGLGRVHGRIDKLLWAVLVGVVGILAQFGMNFMQSGGFGQ